MNPLELTLPRDVITTREPTLSSAPKSFSVLIPLSLYTCPVSLQHLDDLKNQFLSLSGVFYVPADFHRWPVVGAADLEPSFSR
jgi:hypothetical protein